MKVWNVHWLQPVSFPTRVEPQFCVFSTQSFTTCKNHKYNSASILQISIICELGFGHYAQKFSNISRISYAWDDSKDGFLQFGVFSDVIMIVDIHY